MVYFICVQYVALEVRKFQGKNNIQLYFKENQSTDISVHWISSSNWFVSGILDYAQISYLK